MIGLAPLDFQVLLQNGSYTLYTECPRRNVPYFGRVFLMLNYTNITQNTYIQSISHSSWDTLYIAERNKMRQP